MTAALLTLADSRLPAGGHAHSGGVEQAVAAGLVRDPPSLAAFLLRRLTTSGAVAAGLAAVACSAVDETGPEASSRRRRAGSAARGNGNRPRSEPGGRPCCRTSTPRRTH
ncbi:MAG TPA: hypothetical protein VJ352_02570, partial [Geodermatophilus sp.]|nr:hypothetical protein [Geodermatophilus sp.]